MQRLGLIRYLNEPTTIDAFDKIAAIMALAAMIDIHLIKDAHDKINCAITRAHFFNYWKLENGYGFYPTIADFQDEEHLPE